MSNNKFMISLYGNCNRFESWEEIEKVLKPYSKKLKVDIKVIQIGGGCGRIESEPNTLFIYFYACGPIERYSHKIIKQAYGIDLNFHQEDAMTASQKLITVQDDNGIEVAEFTKNNIFVLFNLATGPYSGELIRHIMDDYLVFADPSNPEAEKDFQSLMNLRAIEVGKRFFVKLFREEIDDKISDLDETIRDLESTIRSCQTRIITSVKSRETAFKERRSAQMIRDATNDNFILKKYEALSKMAKGGVIHMTSDSIIIPIGQIDIDYDGQTYDIGEFNLVIYPDGDNGGVRCINKTRTLGNCYHPHVNHNGRCCLGNISDGIALLIGEMEYEVVVTMMMQFLRSYNPEDNRQDIAEWPIKGKGEDDE